jgi:hypothetical protein
MHLYIRIYLLIGVATTLAVLDDRKLTDAIAAILTGLAWPLYIMTRLLRQLR